MNNTFTGKRVKLRAMEPEDLALFLADEKEKDTDRSRADDQINLPKAQWQVREELPGRIKRESESLNFRFMIENLEGETVGTINVHGVDERNGAFSYGIGIFEGYRRKGYAAEAVLLVMRYYFMELRMHKCHSEVYSFNEPSMTLQEHLGFTREGVRRDWYFTRGRYWDLVCYSMLKEEFEEKYKEFSQEG